MPTSEDFLIGEKQIQSRFNMGKGVYNVMLRMGMPVTRINGRVYAHARNIDQWLQSRLKGGDHVISEDDIEKGEK